MNIRILVGLFGWLVWASSSVAAPLGTAFTYQGQLTEGANPANGSYDLKFTLYDDASGGSAVAGPLTNSAVAVSSGMFTVTLDFGGVFTGNARWLELAVRTNATGAFVVLAPRQSLTAAPYASYAPSAGTAVTAATASSVAAANVSGTLAMGQLPAAVVTNNATGVTLGGTFTGSGASLTGVNADLVDGQHGAFYQNAANLTSGTLADARLSSGVALRGTTNTFTGTNVFTKPVGIDCLNPGRPLQVGNPNTVGSQGMIRLASRSSSGEGYMRSWDIGVPETSTNLSGEGYSFVIDDIQVGGTEFMIKYGTGRVGIGRTNPATALDVNGTVTATGFAGNASGLTNLNASQLAAGIVPLAQLPGAVITNNETGVTLAGTFTGNGSGLTLLNGAAIQTGTIGTSQLAAGAVTSDKLAPGIGIVPPGTIVLSATASNAALTAAGYVPQTGEGAALGVNWTEATNAAPWASRDNFGVLSHNGQLWVLGGETGISVPANDIWSSSNGMAWTQVTAAAPWSERYFFAAVTFSNRMWVLGGQGESTLLHDVWSSSNGVAWTQVTNAAPWSARNAHSAAALNGKMWVLGGAVGSVPLHDVWSSSDGLTWTQATSAAPWSARYGHRALAYNNQLWVLGGFDGSQSLQDVWCSSNGVTWVQVTSAAPWNARNGFGAVACEGQMWVLGGYSDSLFFAHDVWSSSNGLTWTRVTSAAPWAARCNLGAVAHNNQIWVLAGVANNAVFFNDVWFSQPPSITMLGSFYLYQKE